MHRLLPHPLLTPALAGIWLLLVNSATPGQILLGLALGWATPLLTLRFWPETVRVYRPLTLLRFVATVLYDILLANLIVARLVLGRKVRSKIAQIVRRSVRGQPENFEEAINDVRAVMAQVMVPDTVVGTARGEAQPLLRVVEFARQLSGITLGAFPVGRKVIEKQAEQGRREHAAAEDQCRGVE